MIGALLTTSVPIMIAIDHLWSDHFLFRLLDISVLLGLVVVIFYVSFWINSYFYKTSIVKIILVNLLAFVVLSIISISIHIPIWEITTRFPLIFYIRDEIVRNITIFIVSYLAAKFYIKNLENQQIKTAFDELQNENLTNQVRGLMQQINPHFFFNTLNTLSGLVQESPEKSEIFIDKLSQVFRYVLKMQENNIVLLREELKFADDYFYLLKMRFDDKIFIRFNLENIDTEKVVPLCTQLLIENVIKHNKMNKQNPLIIEISNNDNYLIISNNICLQNGVNSTGLGLKNLNRRCQLLSQKSIIIEQTDILFCVKVPLI